MLDERLPLHIDPVRLARTGAQLRGRMALAPMERLASLLASPGGEAEVALDFGIDGERRSFVRVRLKAELSLMCQRCLEPMRFQVDTDRRLGVVGSEDEAERLSEAYEPLVFTGEPIFLRDVIEDELILSLPLVPRHTEQCASVALTAEQGTDNTDKAGDNPFAALAKLKT